jgi:hypothetical protein
MEKELYIQCLALGILGLLFHLFAMKIPAVRSRAKAANMPFTLKAYFAEDYPAVIASLITVIIAVLCVDELVGYKPAIMDYLKFFFVFVGFTGSSILISVLGRFDASIKTIVDVKTDIADGK